MATAPPPKRTANPSPIQTNGFIGRVRGAGGTCGAGPVSGLWREPTRAGFVWCRPKSAWTGAIVGVGFAEVMSEGDALRVIVGKALSRDACSPQIRQKTAFGLSVCPLGQTRSIAEPQIAQNRDDAF